MKVYGGFVKDPPLTCTSVVGGGGKGGGVEGGGADGGLGGFDGDGGWGGDGGGGDIHVEISDSRSLTHNSQISMSGTKHFFKSSAFGLFV